MIKIRTHYTIKRSERSWIVIRNTKGFLQYEEFAEWKDALAFALAKIKEDHLKD